MQYFTQLDFWNKQWRFPIFWRSELSSRNDETSGTSVINNQHDDDGKILNAESEKDVKELKQSSCAEDVDYNNGEKGERVKSNLTLSNISKGMKHALAILMP